MPSPESTQQSYGRSKRNYASADAGDTTQELTLKFELNLNKSFQNFVYNTIKSWKMKVFNPFTGEEGLKADYIGKLIIEQILPNGEIYWTRVVNNCFPKGNLDSFGQNDVTSNDPAQLDVVFIGDWYDETSR